MIKSLDKAQSGGSGWERIVVKLLIRDILNFRN